MRSKGVGAEQTEESSSVLAFDKLSAFKPSNSKRGAYFLFTAKSGKVLLRTKNKGTGAGGWKFTPTQTRTDPAASLTDAQNFK